MICVTRKGIEKCRIGLDGIFIRRGRYWYNIVTGQEIPCFEGEGGIAIKNTREYLLSIFNASATVPPHTTTGAAVIARSVAPVSGRVKAVAASVAVVGTRGTSTDFKEGVRCRNAGFAGAGTTVVTGDAVLRDESQPTVALQDPPAGTVRVGHRLSSAAVMAQGAIIEYHKTESGTIGTATRCTFNILGAIFEAENNLDFTLGR